MKKSQVPLFIRNIAIAGGLAACAACAVPPPPPPPPPPPVVQAIPFRPIPPIMAPYQMAMPQVGANGQHLTVNSNLNEDEVIWHFRSGWNVAALNCTGASDGIILDGYRSMLDNFDAPLRAANDSLERQYRSRASSSREALLARESHSTSVYNYFASPPAKADFCATVRQIAGELTTTPPADFNQFAVSGLARFEAAFERFYLAYEKYERDSAVWDSRYGAQYGASQPGWVAVHGDAADRVGVNTSTNDGGQPVVQPVSSGN